MLPSVPDSTSLILIPWYLLFLLIFFPLCLTVDNLRYVASGSGTLGVLLSSMWATIKININQDKDLLWLPIGIC